MRIHFQLVLLTCVACSPLIDTGEAPIEIGPGALDVGANPDVFRSRSQDAGLDMAPDGFVATPDAEIVPDAQVADVVSISDALPPPNDVNFPDGSPPDVDLPDVAPQPERVGAIVPAAPFTDLRVVGGPGLPDDSHCPDDAFLVGVEGAFSAPNWLRGVRAVCARHSLWIEGGDRVIRVDGETTAEWVGDADHDLQLRAQCPPGRVMSGFAPTLAGPVNGVFLDCSPLEPFGDQNAVRVGEFEDFVELGDVESGVYFDGEFCAEGRGVIAVIAAVFFDPIQGQSVTGVGMECAAVLTQ